MIIDVTIWSNRRRLWVSWLLPIICICYTSIGVIWLVVVLSFILKIIGLGSFNWANNFINFSFNPLNNIWNIVNSVNSRRSRIGTLSYYLSSLLVPQIVNILILFIVEIILIIIVVMSQLFFVNLRIQRVLLL